MAHWLTKGEFFKGNYCSYSWPLHCNDVHLPKLSGNNFSCEDLIFIVLAWFWLKGKVAMDTMSWGRYLGISCAVSVSIHGSFVVS